MDIVVFGIGSLGCLFAGLLEKGKQTLSTAAYSLTLLGTWKEQLTSLRQNGLSIVHLDGSESHLTVYATDDPTEIPIVDVCLILVKSYQTEQAAKKASALLSADGICVTLQNGLGNVDILTKALGANRVVAGVTTQAARLLAPGRVQHCGNGPTYLQRVGSQHAMSRGLADTFLACGINIEIVDNIDDFAWKKLALNAVINPLTALSSLSNGELLKRQELHPLIVAILLEVKQVAQAVRVSLSVDSLLAQLDTLCRASAKNESSMLQDVRRKRQTEISSISGAIVRKGGEYGIDTPINRRLFEMVRRLEKGLKVDITAALVGLEKNASN